MKIIIQHIPIEFVELTETYMVERKLLLDVLDELEDTEKFFSELAITDMNLAYHLTALNVVIRLSNGYYIRGDNYVTFRDEVEKVSNAYEIEKNTRPAD